MALKKMMSCYGVLLLLIVVDINGVWSISREEDLELERQLKILNKPGIKTIKVNPHSFTLLYNFFFLGGVCFFT